MSEPRNVNVIFKLRLSDGTDFVLDRKAHNTFQLKQLSPGDRFNIGGAYYSIVEIRFIPEHNSAIMYLENHSNGSEIDLVNHKDRRIIVENNGNLYHNLIRKGWRLEKELPSGRRLMVCI